jgi:iron complex outermembrane recepter protein
MKVLRNLAAGRLDLLMAAVCSGLMTVWPATLLLAAETGQESGKAVLEEITVTAQRRAENLQTVPVTVDTMTSQIALERGVTSFATLQDGITNLAFTSAASSANTYIRGIGSNASAANAEPSAATYVDGVYNPAAYSLMNFEFNNIERVEVLKGPQGTLFGRNATAGVIQFITPDPKHEFGGKFNAGYGNLNTVSGGLYLTGGLSDNLAADFSVIFDNCIDGYGTAVTYDLPAWRSRNTQVRSKWLWEPSEETRVVVGLEYDKYNTDGNGNQYVKESYPPHLAPGNFAGERNVNDGEAYVASLTIDHDFSAVHFKSISAYRDVSRYWEIDSDKLAPVLNHIITDDGGNYFTQEFHLTNKNPGKFDWLLGAYYFDDDISAGDPRIQFGSQVGNGGYQENYGYQTFKSWSLFGQTTFAVSDDTNLTLGLRYTDEKAHLTGYRLDINGNVNGGPYDDELTSSPWTWRIALDHHFTDDVMGYISYNRGFKSGGFNASSPASAGFEPEEVDAYEIGIKSELADHRVRLNVAGYWYDLTNLQVVIVLGGAQLFTNAAEARNRGIEANLEFLASENLTLSAGIGTLDGVYTNYEAVRVYDPLGNVSLIDAKGQKVPNAPSLTAFVNGSYDVSTSVGDFRYAASVSYKDKSYPAPDNGLYRPAYEMVSASAEWRPHSDDSLSIRLWGRNLTSSDYYIFATSSGNGWYVAYGPPITYGLTVEKAF